MKHVKDKELYIAQVIYSCKNSEQLNNCSVWVGNIYPVTKNMSTTKFITNLYARREFQRLIQQMNEYLNTGNIEALV